VHELLQEHRVIAFTGDRLLRMLEDAAGNVAVECGLLEAVADLGVDQVRRGGHIAERTVDLTPPQVHQVGTG